MSLSALVAGGTGLVGGHLVNILVHSNEFDTVKVLVRKGSNFHRDEVETIEVDYDRLEDHRESLKADVVFCCLGTTIKKAGSKDNFRKVDHDYPLALAKICLENGSRQYNLITANGANSGSMFFYNKVKGEVEEAITALSFSSLHIFRPSFLLGARKEKRFGEVVGGAISRILDPVLVGSFTKYKAIKADIVAKGMVHFSNIAPGGLQVIESDRIRELGELYDRN